MTADRRRRLIEVAAAEFAGQGYENASLNTIIALCPMSKSSFYYLFESKADLFDFVVTELLTVLARTVTVPAPQEFAGGAFWERVEALFAGMARAAEHDESLVDLGRMFYSAAPEGARGTVSSTVDAARDWVQEVLRVGRDTGAVRDDLPESLQCELTFGLLQIFDRWSVNHLDARDAAAARDLTAAQFAALKRLLAP
ncbi:TetR/AcrR family transcriptional regulator [Mycobacterium sp. NAZ190054]|uniref:TetR/AcrR family transcriptional regulator n=1 Tax=Mycobacterium sp. NAZ190054 TaxID=1747766 RepID=UPI00079B92B1|nr:TetR/AcrR family transcriptional regulator [Mycobacterium sp. NAZ190054]KWX66632.1 hypothetical protein ASJ79_24740 [Mycobacterium sp. NAZ190054]